MQTDPMQTVGPIIEQSMLAGIIFVPHGPDTFTNPAMHTLKDLTLNVSPKQRKPIMGCTEIK